MCSASLYIGKKNFIESKERISFLKSVSLHWVAYSYGWVSHLYTLNFPKSSGERLSR
jgi:hypothetical protein